MVESLTQFLLGGKVFYTSVSTWPSAVVETNPLAEKPNVMLQTEMICHKCGYKDVCTHRATLYQSNGVWAVGLIYMGAYGVCGSCHDSLSVVDDRTVIIWPQLYKKEIRDKRADKFRGVGRSRPFIVGEDKYWIYWSDGLQMAQAVSPLDRRPITIEADPMLI